MAELSVSVVTYNNKSEIGRLLKSVIEYTKSVEYEITVVDNASQDGTVEYIRENFPTVKVIETGENRGFGHAHNKMLGVNSTFHAVLNPDIELKSDVLGELVSYLKANEEVALVTPKILNPDGTQQCLPKRRPTLKYMVLGRLSRYIKALEPIRDEYTMKNVNIDKPTQIEFCTGCFMVMRTELFKKVGGFDERFFMYLEDVDLTERLSAYGKVMFYPDAFAVHNWEGGSSKNLRLMKIHISSMFKYFKKRKEYK